ncbi:conserved hypothetical protein [Paraburkholderia piptadeniae]|uniref:Uncharacterized protein n=1 Tax=Paraburkholderia piptadeniae TaxID=1701573 RepID=A0A1N7S8R7_9BURK|nr:hypothetical protein [Paraburkholderia piptadeniae]SIT43711.1 conserved hypothetical protein [Paraburkholderia piptadeniae]
MNVKPGDLAIVRSSDVCPEIHGAIVEVLSASAPFKGYGPGWNCTCASMRDAGFAHLPIPDSMPKPISGVPVHDEQLDEVIA